MVSSSLSENITLLQEREGLQPTTCTQITIQLIRFVTTCPIISSF